MAIGDAMKSELIKSNLMADDRLFSTEIDVEVQGNLVVLTGNVSSQEQKDIAEELAYDVEGITDVENYLEVAGSQKSNEGEYSFNGYDTRLGFGPAEGEPGDTAFTLSDVETVPGPGAPTSEQFPGEFTDDEISAEVHEKLTSQDEVDVTDINYAVNNQIVHLSGSVGTGDDINHLLDIVFSARGVMGINSDVTAKMGDFGTPVE